MLKKIKLTFEEFVYYICESQLLTVLKEKHLLRIDSITIKSAIRYLEKDKKSIGDLLLTPIESRKRHLQF